MPELALRVDVLLHEDGNMEVGLQTDRSHAEVAALLEAVINQIRPNMTRAEEAGAWGADRRRGR